MSEHAEAIETAKWVREMGGGGHIIPQLASAVIDMAAEIERLRSLAEQVKTFWPHCFCHDCQGEQCMYCLACVALAQESP